jgi:hypothetical protein
VGQKGYGFSFGEASLRCLLSKPFQFTRQWAAKALARSLSRESEWFGQKVPRGSGRESFMEKGGQESMR